MSVTYAENSGRLHFIWQEGDKKRAGRIPEKITVKGEAVIGQYVARRIAEAQLPKKRRNMRKSNLRKKRVAMTNISIATEYNGQKLRGRIVAYRGENPRRYVDILLEFPKRYSGSECIGGCWAMAVAGIRVWDDEGYLTPWAIARSKEYLIEIYKGKRLIELTRKLNTKQVDINNPAKGEFDGS